jgi:hypothetical protein
MNKTGSNPRRRKMAILGASIVAAVATYYCLMLLVGMFQHANESSDLIAMVAAWISPLGLGLWIPIALVPTFYWLIKRPKRKGPS